MGRRLSVGNHVLFKVAPLAENANGWRQALDVTTHLLREADIACPTTLSGAKPIVATDRP
jgi:hypothetical protein